MLECRSEKVRVWCVLWAGGIIGPCYFKDAGNHNVTVNGELYREMISNFFYPRCMSLTCLTCGFNKTVPHATQRVTMDLLRGEFDKHFISRSGPVNWSPKSCDLTVLNYLSWGYVKAHVYTDKPASGDALEDNIEAFIREISAEILKRVCQN